MDIRAARAPRAGAAATALYGLSPQGPDALLTAVCRSEDIAFDEARELARTAAQCAADGLRAEWSLVEAVTRALLERGAVTADDLTGLYADTHDGQIPPAQQYAPRLTALARAGFRRSDSTWRYLDGVSGPQLSLTSTGDIIGELVTTELDARGLQLCRLVSVGGDASTDPQFGSVTMIGAVLPSTALPPTDGPPVGGLFADWNPTEGSGQVVTAKNLAAGVRDLILGDTTGNSTRDPISWSTSPPKLRTQGFLTVDHHYLHHDSIPSLASGCSIFFYGSILAATSFLNRALCGVDTGVEDHRIVITSGGNIAAVVREGTGFDRTAVGTTVISAGSAHTYCLTHDAASLTLKVYLDGELEGSAACGTAAFSTLPRRFVLGCGTAPFTAHQGPDDWSIGRTLFYTRALIDAEAAGAHRVFQQTYTDLP